MVKVSTPTTESTTVDPVALADEIKKAQRALAELQAQVVVPVVEISEETKRRLTRLCLTPPRIAQPDCRFFMSPVVEEGET